MRIQEHRRRASKDSAGKAILALASIVTIGAAIADPRPSESFAIGALAVLALALTARAWQPRPGSERGSIALIAMGVFFVVGVGFMVGGVYQSLTRQWLNPPNNDCEEICRTCVVEVRAGWLDCTHCGSECTRYCCR